MITDIYPLSPIQEGLLFHFQLKPKSDAYHVQSLYDLDGVINPEIMKLACEAVVLQHAVLRIGFRIEKLKKPLQYIIDVVKLPWIIINWQNYSEKEQEEKVRIFLIEDRKKTFDLTIAPLFRFCLIQRSEGKSWILFTHHHILMDGWSVSILFRDLVTAYEQIFKNQKILLRPSLPYREYIQYLQKQNKNILMSFWHQYLEDYQGNSLITQSNNIQKNKNIDEWSDQYVYLSEEETICLKNFANENNLTLNTIVQSAWAILLSRFIDKDDVIFGIIVSGRNIEIPTINEMVGLFINNLPLRVIIKNTDRIIDLLTRMQFEIIELIQHTNISLAEIQKIVKKEEFDSISTINGNLFDHILIFENYPQNENDQKNFSLLKANYSINSVEKIEYPLTLFIGPGKKLSFQFSYNRNYFSSENIALIAKVLKNIIQEIQVNSLQIVNHISLATVEDLNTILYQWNKKDFEYPDIKFVHALIEKQAVKNPHKKALVYEEKELTYKSLNETSNQFAHYLIEMMVRPEILIAVCLERSVELVTILIGIWKSGGGYLPLDPHYPQERLQLMLEESKALILITKHEFKNKFTGFTGKIVYLQESDTYLNKFPINNIKSCSAKSNLAYMIFTSGSTGRPKGVQITHDNLFNFSQAIQQEINLNSNSKFLSVTSISFDIFGLEMCLPLIVGASVYLASQKMIKNADILKEILVRYNCNVMQATALIWTHLLIAGWEPPKGFKILFGGEVLTLSLLKKLWREDIELWNLYGPTETTIWSTAKKIINPYHCSIGQPILNTDIYILDKNLNLVPIGFIGEIYIGGSGVSRGYFNQPGLTAEKFIANPFGAIDNYNRLYKTGDLGRYSKEGDIEYIGRIDQQIKFRGHRIELEEIEYYLEKLPSIKQAIVTLQERNKQYIQIAHIVPNNITLNIKMDFSLFYFSADQHQEENDPYELLMKSAIIADKAGFKALWTPERHFHAVGGQYPNPSVLSAALAMITENIEIRAGSVVLPLHHPLRVIEEWSIVDNLSKGRVGISFASGWHPNDFIFYPENYKTRKKIMLNGIREIKKIWKDRNFIAKNGLGDTIEGKLFPKPIQTDLPIWITASGNPDTFIESGKIGANLLTHLLGQSLQELEKNIKLYKKALRENGFNPSQYQITLMLHTFVADEEGRAINISKLPFCNYLNEHLSLASLAKDFNIDKHEHLSEKDKDDLIKIAFERYVKTSSLIGTVDSCLERIKILNQIGVNEIACFIDFGIEKNLVLEGIKYIEILQEKSRQSVNIEWLKIREQLKNSLPDHMIPRAYEIHENFPTTHNNKIDRLKLQKTTLRSMLSNDRLPIRAPSTPLEKDIAAMWQDILGVNIQSVWDNFFSIGGHSLTAAQFISRLRAHLNIDIPLKLIFEYPTLSEISKSLEENLDNDIFDEKNIIQYIGGSGQPFFLIHPLRSMVFSYKPLANYLKNFSLYAVHDPNIATDKNPFKTLEEVASYYLGHIKKLHKNNTYRLGGWSFGGTVAFEIASQLEKMNEKVDLLIMIDSYNFSAYEEILFDSENIDQKLFKHGVKKESREWLSIKQAILNSEMLEMNYNPKIYNEKVILIKAEHTNYKSKYAENTNGWGKIIRGLLEIHIVSGTHDELFNVDKLPHLGQKLEQICTRIKVN